MRPECSAGFVPFVLGHAVLIVIVLVVSPILLIPETGDDFVPRGFLVSLW